MRSFAALGVLVLSIGCSRAAPIKADLDSEKAPPTAQVPSSTRVASSARVAPVAVVASGEPARAAQDWRETAREDPAPAPPASPPGPRRPGDPDDVREATFRYMFGSNASGQQQNALVFCLQLENNADPSAAFIARFSKTKQHVLAASACDASAYTGVVEKATGKSGLIFRVDGIKWVDDDHAEVSGGYYEAGLSASGNTYFLERAHGAWHVTKDVMSWIS
jgi:hypothetical protein